MSRTPFRPARPCPCPCPRPSPTAARRAACVLALMAGMAGMADVAADGPGAGRAEPLTEPVRDTLRDPLRDTLRDPLLPPAAARPAPAPSADGAAPGAAAPRHLMTVDGRRYVVAGTRRLGVGDRLDGARIVRIDDSAVHVHDGSAVQRLPLYGAVQRRAIVDPAPSPAAAAPRRNAQPGAQPGAQREARPTRPGAP